MIVSIDEFANSFTNETIIEIYSNEEEIVLGAWWSTEIPEIFHPYNVDSMDMPIERPYSNRFPVLTVNSDDITLDSLRGDVEFYGYEFTAEDSDNDWSGMYVGWKDEMYG